MSSTPSESFPARAHRPIRRIPHPRTGGLFDSPTRNLLSGGAFMLVVMCAATAAYLSQGWSLSDAIYMVIITVFTVGYDEVRPIDTPLLRAITIGQVVLGCTGMIFLTGALVQFFTVSQINRLGGRRRMSSQIEQLKGHVVVCGFGRLGTALARTLSASSAGFVVLEESPERAAEARALGYLCVEGDATSEESLRTAGVERAHALATVLSKDALNVFITLSARSLNPNILIVARGELPSTESKLLQAGADKVVMPTHIGAERVGELLLYAESARLLGNLERTHGFQTALRGFGIELEVVTVAPNSPAVRMTVAAIERQAKGAFFIIQINRQDGDVHISPPPTAVIGEGDGIMLMGRPNRAAILTSLFEPRQRVGVRG